MTSLIVHNLYQGRHGWQGHQGLGLSFQKLAVAALYIGMNVEPKIQILKSNSNSTHRAVREVHCTNAIQPSFTTLWGLMQNCSGIIPSKTTGHAVYSGTYISDLLCQIFGIFSKIGHYCTHKIVVTIE